MTSHDHSLVEEVPMLAGDTEHGSASRGSAVCAAPSTATPINVIVAALRDIEVLRELREEELVWLAAHGSERVGPDRAIVFRQNEPARHLNIILRGDVCVYRENLGAITLFIGHTGRVTGKLPYSRMKLWAGSGSTSGPVWLLDIHEDLFPEMLRVIPSMGQLSVSLLLDRTRDFTRADQQAEKLDALGKLAANLSHELKNPASAAQRAAVSLLSNIDREDELCRLGRLFRSDEELGTYRRWAAKALAGIEAAEDAHGTTANSLSESDREEEILGWLDAHRVPHAWKTAPVLAAVNLPVALLEELRDSIGKEVFPAAITSFAASLNARVSARTILESSSRIFSIIQAIQDYSYMDQVAIQDVDLVLSLESALTLLSSRAAGVEIVRDFSADMPTVSGYGGELSQVWTALLENAFAAMKGKGVLKVTVKMSGEMAFVEVCDDGPGIDPAIASRIFEPFFTTQPLGKALGLGLDIVRRIVHKHLGNVTMQSVPHSTCFQVRLPLRRPLVY